MAPNLVPNEPLSQVVFVHDYIQLVFQEATFSIYNDPEILSGTGSFSRSKTGFCDALVGLIETRVQSVTFPDGTSLVLTFCDGSVFTVGRFGRGPEAWCFQSDGGPIVVEQNA